MNTRTFDEFWSEFLQVTFHLENPDRWPSRERKARWLTQIIGNSCGSVLDLGCGDGLLDIWLSRFGYQVTAVDRSQKVIELARAADDTEKVLFKSSDLRTLDFSPRSFDSVLFLETAGLLKLLEDRTLIEKIYKWLRPGGRLIVDSPDRVEHENSWQKSFAEGTVSCRSTFDSAAHMQRIEFSFDDLSGEHFGLLDPIRDELPGISRYIYPKDELTDILREIGFSVDELPHYYPQNYYALVARKEA